MKAREIFEYNKLTWPEMNDAIELGKVVLLPTGSTEQHGAAFSLTIGAMTILLAGVPGVLVGLLGATAPPRLASPAS